MNKIYLSQKEAKRLLRSANFSVKAAAAAVAAMAKVADGKREKVKSADLRRIIDEAARPTPPKPLSIRPVVSKYAPKKEAMSL